MSTLTIMLLPLFLCSLVVVQSFTMPPRNDDGGSQVQHEPRIRYQKALLVKKQSEGTAAASAALNHLKHRPNAVSGARKTTRQPFKGIPAAATDDSSPDDHLYAPSDPLPGPLMHQNQASDTMLQETTRGEDHGDHDDHNNHDSGFRSYVPKHYRRRYQHHRQQQQEQMHQQPEQQSVTPEFYLSPASSFSSPTTATKDMMAESSHHQDQHEWLDMGAYSGKQGSFGWYADFPVGGIDAKAHGRRR